MWKCFILEKISPIIHLHSLSKPILTNPITKPSKLPTLHAKLQQIHTAPPPPTHTNNI